jgi:hypothetical protein
VEESKNIYVDNLYIAYAKWTFLLPPTFVNSEHLADTVEQVATPFA